MELLSILFFALEHDSPIVQEMLFLMFHLDIETLNSPYLESWYIHLCVCRQLKSYGDRLTNEVILIFSSPQNLGSPKIHKYAITFDLSRHPKSSLSATTGYFFSTERFPLLKIVSDNNSVFRSLRLTCHSPKMSRSIFQYGVSIL